MRRNAPATPVLAAMLVGCGLGGWLGWWVETPSDVAAPRSPSAQVAELELVATGSADVALGGGAVRQGPGETVGRAAAVLQSAEHAERAVQRGAPGGAGDWHSPASHGRGAGEVAASASAGASGDTAAPPEDTLSWLDVARDEYGVLAHARGRDLAAPRELALWRVEPRTGQAALLARGRSRVDGGFAFDRLLVSQREVHLVVAGSARARPSLGAQVGEPDSPIATLEPARQFESLGPTEPDPTERFERFQPLEELP